MVPDNAQKYIPIKHNFSQTREIFDGRIMDESEVLCVFILMIYFISFLFMVTSPLHAQICFGLIPFMTTYISVTIMKIHMSATFADAYLAHHPKNIKLQVLKS